jgi:hypothetical protein
MEGVYSFAWQDHVQHIPVMSMFLLLFLGQF